MFIQSEAVTRFQTKENEHPQILEGKLLPLGWRSSDLGLKIVSFIYVEQQKLLSKIRVPFFINQCSESRETFAETVNSTGIVIQASTQLHFVIHFWLRQPQLPEIRALFRTTMEAL